MEAEFIEYDGTCVAVKTLLAVQRDGIGKITLHIAGVGKATMLADFGRFITHLPKSFVRIDKDAVVAYDKIIVIARTTNVKANTFFMMGAPPIELPCVFYDTIKNIAGICHVDTIWKLNIV